MPPASRGLVSLLQRHAAPRAPRVLSFQRTYAVRPLKSPPSPPPPPPPHSHVSSLQTSTPARTNASPSFSTADAPPIDEDTAHSHGDDGGDSSRGSAGQIFSSAAFRRWTYRAFIFVPTLLLLGLHFPLEPMRVCGDSMAPFLNVDDDPTRGDWVLVQRALTAPRLRRGMVVVFWAPHASRDGVGRLAVKRVVGVAGDRVRPLNAGADADGEAESVTVPYGHVWVEGDVNDRARSVDSNWYGPVSENLVVGVALAVVPGGSWWPVRVAWERDPYPAKQSGRVQMDVVREAAVNPDAVVVERGFHDGSAERELDAMRRRRDDVVDMVADPRKLKKMRKMYGDAKRELRRGDPVTEEVARGLIVELERAFVEAGLGRDGRTGEERATPPALGAGLGEQDEVEGETQQERRLRRYLERMKKQEESAAKT